MTPSSNGSPTSLFNSYVFLFLFLPVVLAIWYLAPLKRRGRLIAITVASYVFYGYWDWRFTGLMLASTGIDFVAGARIHATEEAGSRRRWLVTSLAANLGLLGVFKYLGFFARSVNALGALTGVGAMMPVFDIVLPIGISFYTFQSMSYTLDIYLRRAAPTEGFWSFAAYVSLFPQLVAGPIVRYTHLEAQLRALDASPDPRRLRLGFQLLVLGLAKKLVIADALGIQVDRLFLDVSSMDLGTSWLAVLGYANQLYFDFSGYSDMAVGLGKLLGFDFPQNFDSPFQAVDISDFWRRWHMTLSGWFRDYVYLPLAANLSRIRRLRRRPLLVASSAMLVTMAACGLWHGAQWTFVIWGIYHGVLLVVCQVWKSRGTFGLSDRTGRCLTFLAVLVSFVIFRAPDLASAWQIMRCMAGLQGAALANLLSYLEFAGDISAALLICWWAPNSWEMKHSSSRRSAVVYGFLLALCVSLLRRESPFLYFQF